VVTDPNLCLVPNSRHISPFEPSDFLWSDSFRRDLQLVTTSTTHPSHLETKTLGIQFKIDFGLLEVFFLVALFLASMMRVSRLGTKAFGWDLIETIILAGTARSWVIRKVILMIHINFPILPNESFHCPRYARILKDWHDTCQLYGYLFERALFLYAYKSRYITSLPIECITKIFHQQESSTHSLSSYKPGIQSSGKPELYDSLRRTTFWPRRTALDNKSNYLAQYIAPYNKPFDFWNKFKLTPKRNTAGQRITYATILDLLHTLF
jgi:hypothetical protein